MKTIIRYIIWEILKVFAVILVAIVIFIMISLLMDELQMLLRHKPPASLIINYFFLKTPFLAAQALPFSMLLSILYVFSQLGRFNELTAIKSVGISYTRLITPILFLSFLISILAIVANETIVSRSYEKASYIREVLIEKKQQSGIEAGYDIARFGKNGRIFYMNYFDGLIGIMKGVTIIDLNPDFTIRYRLDAKEGKRENGVWIITDGIERNFERNREVSVKTFKSLKLSSEASPQELVKSAGTDPESMLAINIFRLKKLIKALKESGMKYTEESVAFHLKLAFPFATFILALLGVSIPFILPQQRSIINAALGFLFTVIASFFYMGFVTIGLSLGKVSVMPPWVAAWIANFVFSALGIYFLKLVRK